MTTAGVPQPRRPVGHPTAGLEDLVISGVELDDRQGRVTVLDLPDRPGFAASILRRIADETIFVDMIVQNISLVGTPNLSITVPRKDVERASAAASVVGPDGSLLEPSIAKLSVMGVGMRSHTGVAAHMFHALAEREIEISMINTSEVWINVVTGVGEAVRVWNACVAHSFNRVARRSMATATCNPARMPAVLSPFAASWTH